MPLFVCCGTRGRNKEREFSTVADPVRRFEIEERETGDRSLNRALPARVAKVVNSRPDGSLPKKWRRKKSDVSCLS